MHCTAVDIGYMMVITIGDKVQYICSSYDGSLIEEGTLHAGDLWARIHGYYLVSHVFAYVQLYLPILYHLNHFLV